MKRNTVRLFKVSIFTALSMSLIGAASVGAELVRNPTAVGGAFDLGQIVQGTLYNSTTAPTEKTENQVITRTGVYLTESGVYNDRLTIQLTIGGLFWFSLPESESFQTRRIQFGPGVGQAQGVYAFGEDPSKPVATLQFGLFPHKYGESVNLGEYLYRSGTYPGTLTSGGWSYINAASYMAQGIRVNVPMLDGKLNNDVTLYMERDLEPTNDLSPGYMLTYRPTDFFEVGAGVIWAHAISMNGKRLSPKNENSRYSKSTGRPTKNDTDTLSLCAVDASANPDDCGYYTFKGFKTAARASLDLGTLIGSDMIAKGDFKLYSEIALLGVEDQPFYYEKKSERMPVMFGANFPTFGILDRLSAEAEYLKSRFPNDNSSVLQSQLPVPISNSADPFTFTPKGNWKWTVYGKRHITDGLNIYLQAANDHLRHFNFAAIPGAVPATNDPSDWYYVLRLEFGI
jgi:hypothetical protein